MDPTDAPQAELFASQEGDRWWARNREHLVAFDPEHDPITALLRQARIRPRSIIEVGAANGARVAALATEHGARGVAVEPSAAAVADGRERFPHIELHQGRADAVPVTGPFDLVIVSFVLHWVDRALLLRSAAEVDRLVGDSGNLVIADFLPDAPCRVRYHHRDDVEVWTFKQDYAAMFAATERYREVVRLVGRHGGAVPDPSAGHDDRICFSLLARR